MGVEAAAIAFGSAVLGALVGSWVTVWLGARKERKDEVRNRLRDIYMRLLELHQFYFWLATAEVHREEPRSDVGARVERLAWGILDDLREIDEHPSVPALAEVLAADDDEKFPDAVSRHQEIGKVLNEIGSELNPKYMGTMRQIGEKRLRAIGSEMMAGRAPHRQRSNAPAMIGM